MACRNEYRDSPETSPVEKFFDLYVVKTWPKSSKTGPKGVRCDLDGTEWKGKHALLPLSRITLVLTSTQRQKERKDRMEKILKVKLFTYSL